MRRRRRSAFTLVEIMIVILVIGMLLNIATPAFLHARDLGQARACVANLRNITSAKEQFALEHDASNTYTPVWSDISPYIKSKSAPLCPTNGSVYQLNDIKSYAACSYGGPVGLPHVLN
ncbi:MAG: Prepilin-type cleavage/methylation protein [Capsulimonas sp.]|jgi:prepilin-type N-terminal cleavage/methylation domain-containing protein|nr:Prepilin-type cleavage/methylation protein [Capsulimonas sp.]